MAEYRWGGWSEGIHKFLRRIALCCIAFVLRLYCICPNQWLSLHVKSNINAEGHPSLYLDYFDSSVEGVRRERSIARQILLINIRPGPSPPRVNWIRYTPQACLGWFL